MTLTADLPADGLPKRRHRLSTRIVASALIVLVVVLGMTSVTLWLSWRLEGAGAAINDTGSLRMRAHRIAVVLLQGPATPEREAQLQQQFDAMDATLARLQRGNPQRPLLLPDHPAIRAQLQAVDTYWHEQALPAALSAWREGDASAYLATLPVLVEQADRLVGMIEQDNAAKTTGLRLAQAGLAGLAAVCALAMIYLLYLWIIVPVLRLRDGLQRMAAREFSSRLPVESRDEFGVLAAGYNQMADTLQNLYGSLEQRVEDKTRQLAEQNREISALYDMAAFLNESNDIDSMCQGFLTRVRTQCGADGASLRTLDPSQGQLSLVASSGLSSALTDSEYCMAVNDCHCVRTVGDLASIPIHDLSQDAGGAELNCQREGFSRVAVFPITSGESTQGSFSLHFREPQHLPASVIQLLGSQGQLLGVALENHRLEAKARELAVVQERNLVAQSLHDSLAQGLNFLNLQLQLLEDAVRRRDGSEIDEIVPLLRTGVEESYQDVRELLTNFRSKLTQGSLRLAIEDTVARFRRQSGCTTVLEIQQTQGSPLAPDQQLQVLFILQEALSNVRKHAQAQQVTVRVDNARDFTLLVEDDGQGYDPHEVALRGEAHVGLHIMRERAARMNAVIQLESTPGGGSRVRLRLPASERLAA